MAKKEKQPLEKKGWRSSFELVGKVVITDNSFKIDEHSNKSDWIYNQMNIGVQCGEKCGTVWCSCSGGYGANRDNLIYVHGKSEDGKSDNFQDQITVDFNDRFDTETLEKIGNQCFSRAALEKATDGKLFVRRFLHNYDLIKYIKDNLVNGTVVRITGDLQYRLYENNVYVDKIIRNIYLSDAEESKFDAKFTQTVLIGRDSFSDYDKGTRTANIDAIVLEYNRDIKGNVPIHKDFIFTFPEKAVENEKNFKAVKDGLFGVSRGYTEITYEGQFVEGGATVQLTIDDLDDDIKTLIECGVYTLEEALKPVAQSGRADRKMLILKAAITVDENGKKVTNKIEQKYSEDDLDVEIPSHKDEKETNKSEAKEVTLDDSDDTESFLDSLGL